MSSSPALAAPIETGSIRLANFWSDFKRSPVALAALIIVVIIVLMAVFAPFVAPQDPYNQEMLDLFDARLEPGETGSGGYVHWLGTDAAGRDIFSAILYGLRTSLIVGVMASTFALVLGATVGLMAAYYGGRIEAIIMRIIDLQLSLPAILLALVLVAMLGQGLMQLIAALVAAQYAYFARTTHGAASAERRKDYIEAALSTPLPARHVLFRHLLPNALPPLIVVATVQVANSIALEATLSFLGLGLPITQPSLGSLISNGFQFLLSGRYWISIYPGIALMLTVVAINLVGDQVRSVLNPRNSR
ncbi:MAG: ABC transporter permease [Pseudomonadota bacterium]|jgi:peptide/nickel transport system permease protein|nr:ABC transporter permease [Pseudomonadota bacterium]